MSKKLVWILALVFSAAVLTACEEDGPLEEAGESADQKIEQMGDKIEDSTDR